MLPFCIVKANLPKNLLRSITISNRHSDIAALVHAIDISKVCFVLFFYKLYTFVFMFQEQCDSHFTQIWVPSNPKGAERLPPGIIASESDLYLRRLWGNPEEVCFSKPHSHSWILHFYV